MFESDDFDQILSQFDFPEVASEDIKKKETIKLSEFSNNFIATSHSGRAQQSTWNKNEPKVTKLPCSNTPKSDIVVDKDITSCSADINEELSFKPREVNKDEDLKLDTFAVPKHNKRKLINSYFDHQSKRKFPGPAGLLTGTLEIPKDDSICQIELLSQDIDYSQHNLRRDLFESPIWSRLLSDIQYWKLEIDSIQAIKQQALSGNLRRKKAQSVTAFIEAVDRSATDPLIILKDSTGSIKCTLHRDAWSNFSQYIVSDCCALILQKPTVLTTGGAFKKHYLNITLSNILAIYSSTVLNEDGNKTLPDGYSILYDDEFTVIKTEKCSDRGSFTLEENNGAEDLVDGLDSFFSDDIF